MRSFVIRSIACIVSFPLALSFMFMMQPAFAQAASIGNVSTSELIQLTNQDRQGAGLGTVSENALLDQAAQLKAADMAAKGYFSHTSPGGETSWTWFKEAGYAYVYAGENLAEGYSSSDAVNTAWLNSPEHRANIMKPQYTQIGMAVSQGTYNGQAVIFVVQMFGSPQNAVVAAKQPATQPLAAATVTSAPKVATASASTKVLGTQAVSVPAVTDNPTSDLTPSAISQMSPTQQRALLAQLIALVAQLEAKLATLTGHPVA